MKFTFRSGQQPLPGYTIKRGIGLGGFGEVYFAVTDGGKEVALKWIRANLDIEMRGVQQCLNLKHPNLVHLYDVRTDEQGGHWLVMEYVAGEPLSTILSRHPNGVAPELAAQWFQGLAQAIHCLHEHGIVHRDLKPGNIFLENGLIKVGDYGLCKLIADSQHAGMTKDVGTVHYMAPEISTGNYNRQIDIYAAGVLLYEMLTGHVPFEGESAGEILMKHLTAPPDLSRVPKEFVPVLQKALTKNPANRYATIPEMAKEVAAVVGVNPSWPALKAQASQPAPQPSLDNYPMAIPVTPTLIFQQRWADLSGILLWSIVAAAALAGGWTLIAGGGDYSRLWPLFFLVLATSWSVLIPSKLWPPENEEDSWTRRLMHMSLGFAVALFALWLDGYELPAPWTPPAQLKVLQPWPTTDESRQALRQSWVGRWYGSENSSMPILACYLSYFGLMFLVLRWWKTTEKHRSKRVSFLALAAVAIWAYLLLFLLPSIHQRELGFLSMVMASVVCQVTCPWKLKVPSRRKKLRLATA
ncbi:MAG: serine/threonine protein kinase [Planctomycetes bacterium]|nr:serine/threonine protein kinase [Planctomycetota bacterium]